MIDVDIMNSCAQGIFFHLKELHSRHIFYFSAVYGFNTIEARKYFWTFVDSICSSIQGPMIFCGDYNSMLLVEDRKNGNPLCEADIKDFYDCLHRNDLAVMRTIGDYYMWCNNQDDKDIIFFYN